jgi:DNA repair protein RecO (recombination protein O)
MSKTQNISGIIIRITDRRPPDLNVTILTPSLGKIICLAKGVKKISSRRIGSLQMGNIISAQIYNHQGFNWLTEVRSDFQFLHHQKSLIQLNLLFYILEILNRFLAENQHIDGVFQISQQLILSIYENNFEKLIQNEIKLLEVLGFGIPPEVEESFKIPNLPLTQQLLRRHMETILDHPLESNKLFR